MVAAREVEIFDRTRAGICAGKFIRILNDLKDDFWKTILNGYQFPACRNILCTKEVILDATDLPDGQEWRKGIGCGAVSLFEDGTVAHVYHLDWPKEFLEEVDEKVVRFGNKTTFLEIIGMLLVMVLNPLFFKNQT
jgi:hypothetical protein